jgi:hypothetical protein
MLGSLAMVLSSQPTSCPSLKNSCPTSGKPDLSAKFFKAPYNIDKDFAG